MVELEIQLDRTMYVKSYLALFDIFLDMLGFSWASVALLDDLLDTVTEADILFLLLIFQYSETNSF